MDRITLIRALKYMLFSVLSFTTMTTLIKYLSHIPSAELVFFRSLGSMLICWFLLAKDSISPWGNQKKLLIGRSLFGLSSMLLFFESFKHIPYGSAVSLRYLSPIFAAILAVFLLKERIKLIQWLCFIIAFIGVLLLKGFDPRINLLGLGIIMTSSFCVGMVYVLIRKIGEREHSLVIINYFMTLSTILGLVLSVFNWYNPIGIEWLLLIGTGIMGFFGQLFMTKAYQIASVGSIAPVKYLESVFAITVGWVWFGEQYTFIVLLGIGLIISGMLINLVVK